MVLIADKDKIYFKLKETNLKRAWLDTSGATHELKANTTEASYAIAMNIAKKTKTSYHRRDPH